MPGRGCATRDIPPEQVRKVFDKGKVLRRYPEDEPLESYLVYSKVPRLGQSGGANDPEELTVEQGDENLLRPVHVVAADNDEREITIVITVYVPDDDKWEDDYRWKKSWTTVENTWRE